MSERPDWINDLVDLLFMARMCGATCKEAADAAWNECSPDSPKNKKAKRERSMVKARRPTPARADQPHAPPRYDGRLHERDWWPLRNAVLARDNYECVYCGDTELTAPLCADHVVPLSRGGTNDETNLVACCIPCNSSKNNRLLSEWRGRYQ